MIINDLHIFITEGTITGILVKQYADTEDGTVTLGTYGNGETTLCIRRDNVDEEGIVKELISKVTLTNDYKLMLNDRQLTYLII